MQEIIRLLNAIDDVQTTGLNAAIATVVRVKGSAYRREGTKMLIDATGKQVCMISGGCLEQEVGEIAKQVMETGKSKVQFFDLDEDLVWGLGLGCGGAVDVYIEPFDKGQENAAWLKAVRNQKAACLATVIETNSSEEAGVVNTARLFISVEGETIGSLGNVELDQDLVSLAQEKMSQLYPRPETKQFVIEGQIIDVFLDVNVPPPDLLLFGAGHDAIPMAQFAHEIGFNVTVVDARHAFVSAERFPNAKTLVRTHPSGFEEKVSVSPRTYTIIMNHHLERDAASLKFLLGSEAPYIGVLGPRSRFNDMLEQLESEGVDVSEQILKRVRNPIGVDVGADSAEEIAVSVMAELLAVRGNYQAGFLANREGPIHTDRVR